MKNPFKILKYYWIYRKQVLKNSKYLAKQHYLNIDNINRMWTVIDLSTIPKDIIDKVGKDAAVYTEIKKYINTFNRDLGYLELNELVNVYEIKSLENTRYGITFGYSLYNNILLHLWFLAIILLIITGTILIIL